MNEQIQQWVLINLGHAQPGQTLKWYWSDVAIDTCTFWRHNHIPGSSQELSCPSQLVTTPFVSSQLELVVSVCIVISGSALSLVPKNEQFLTNSTGKQSVDAFITLISKRSTLVTAPVVSSQLELVVSVCILTSGSALSSYPGRKWAWYRLHCTCA